MVGDGIVIVGSYNHVRNTVSDTGEAGRGRGTGRTFVDAAPFR